ncbi:MAG: pimeloyl-ACP methyl ester carboxylesterase [Planctomycetota bacterium]|jgi:pimeloyl-ACP methyl ester carboxylesterase
MTDRGDFVSIEIDRHRLSIEYQWLGEGLEDSPEEGYKPLVVFLHEGLGSRAMWKDFPARLCHACGCRGLVYSRPGYGRSTAREVDQHWQPNFMHAQAHRVLPALFKALGIDTALHPPLLFGHSDGGSIALLYAARFPRQVAGLILLAPHILVEDISIASIKLARKAYLDTDLKQKLGRYHENVDSAFWGWNDIWLSPAFRDWSIEDELVKIRCPILAVQGVDDAYGTLEQIHGIARRVAQTEIIALKNCGHSPHRDQGERLIERSVRFMQNQRLTGPQSV